MKYAPILLSLCFAADALAQGMGGTRADYELFDRYAATVAGKVVGDRLEPYWIGASARFWFREDAADGTRRFFLVDAAAATPRRARRRSITREWLRRCRRR